MQTGPEVPQHLRPDQSRASLTRRDLADIVSTSSAQRRDLSNGFYGNPDLAQVRIADERGALGATIREAIVLPNPDCVPSNYHSGRHNEVPVFVHGITKTAQDLEHQAQTLADVLGRPVHVVINPAPSGPWNRGERSHLLSVLQALQGIVSGRNGFEATRAPSELLLNTLWEHFDAGRRVLLVAHSQGSVIAQNALEVFLHVADAAARRHIRQNLRVLSLGAAKHEWPKGVQAVEFAHSGDKVAAVTSGVDVALKMMGMRCDSREAPCVVIDHVAETDHWMTDYLKHLPRFLAEERGMKDGHYCGRTLAQWTLQAIRDGAFSDQVFQALIHLRVEMRDRAFAQAFMRGMQGGRVGEFLVPYLQELQALSG